MNPELLNARKFIQEKIFQFVMKKQTRKDEMSQKRVIDLVKSLEEGILMTSTSKEEYLNLDTLEIRLNALIMRPNFSLPTENGESADNLNMHAVSTLTSDGDRYAMDDVDSSGSRNFFSSTSVGSVMNNQNLNQASAYSTLMHPELVEARAFIHEKIYQWLIEKPPQSGNMPLTRVIDLAKRLEEGLFKTTGSKEEYMNLDTLKHRLHLFINKPQFCSCDPQLSLSTRRMSEEGNSSLIPSSHLRPQNQGLVTNNALRLYHHVKPEHEIESPDEDLLRLHL